MQFMLTKLCNGPRCCNAVGKPSDGRTKSGRALISRPCARTTVRRRRRTPKLQTAAKRRKFTQCYSSSSDEERSYESTKEHWQSQQTCAEPAPAPASIPDNKNTLYKGAILLAAAAAIAATLAYVMKSRRPGQRSDAGQQSLGSHRRAPQSEAELDNTVRTLTEQRLEHVSANPALPSITLRQPAQATWRPQGVGQYSCQTRTYNQQQQLPQYKEHATSGSAALVLMRLQLQYLVFLKQSDSINGLKQTAQPVVK